MNAWYDAGGYQRKTGIELIIDYTMWLTSSIYTTMVGILKESKQLGLSGYLKWLGEMQNIENEKSAT